MTDSIPQPLENKSIASEPSTNAEPRAAQQPQDSYVKLAMRNMVRKGRQSLWHFFLTTVSILSLLVGLAYLTKP
ncbi:MAG: DUF3285 domain-containing protein [Cyanobacteria bacterium J06621_8]